MQRFFQTAGVVLILALPSFAENMEPVPAPADIGLQFRTEGDQQQFRLGELIPVKFSYSADIPGRYIWVSQSKKLVGGHPLEVSCSPSAERVNSWPPSYEVDKFAQMLNSCGGVGGGIGSGCGDCDWEQTLGTGSVAFGPIPLNTYVRFRTPGTYSCIATSADVTTTLPDEKIRSALLLTSNHVVLNIVADLEWSHSAASSYAAAYDKLCRGDDVPERHSLQCFDVASRITYLDTIDSLATEVRLFDGRNHGWDNGFWNGILRTSYPTDALRLMANRIQDSDVEVSQAVLESLASWELRIDSPDAFQTASPATYHAQAVDKLRRYVRLLGISLANKNSNVLRESAKTYRVLAEREYCEQQPLILKPERNQVLANTRSE
jgi:hypothetical protein